LALVVALLISGGILTWAGFNDPQEVNGTLNADATPAAPISRLPTATGRPMAVTRKVSASPR
jgi:glucose dehydrogenase